KDHPEPGAAEKEPAPSVKHLKEKLKKREAEVKHLKKEIEELKDQYVRKLADLENLRKRIEREKADYFQYALSEVLLEFLGIIDNFQRALQASAGEADGKTFRDGIDLIYRMSQSLLFKRGVQPIEIKDGVFDPTLHHAMAMEESEEVKEPRVTEELQKGYMLHNRLLRPALVKVVVPSKKKD
ncbi:MAG: nucleotide exchange factor GrpE, partial [Candidatus Aminicenantales bacterium]